MIKQFFNPGIHPNNTSYVLLLLRVIVGIFMLTHGMGKFYKLIGDAPIQFADPLGVGLTASLALTVFAEVFCSILLILGLLTRIAAIPLIITMLVVAFVVHGSDGFGSQELPIMYLMMYLVIAILGAGKISLDKLIYSKINQSS